MNIRDPRNGNYRAYCGLLNVYLVKPVIFVKGAYLDLPHFFGIVGVYDHGLLIDPYDAVGNLSDPYPSHIIVIINGTDQNLCAGLSVPLGGGNEISYGIKQRRHIRAYIGRVRSRSSKL